MKREFEYFEKDGQFFPAIDIAIRGPMRERAFKALIDSGASFSIFRADVAELLGIDVEKGKSLYLVGIGGRILGYLHEVPVSIDGTKFFICKIIFSREFTVSFNLLGRDNFFLPFIISFKEKQKKITIENI